MNSKNNLKRVKELIDEADMILIGAGAGLSTSAGIDYSPASFQKYFSEYVKEYGMTDLYSSSFYPFKTENEKWAYWSRHIDYTYLSQKPRSLYLKIFDLIKDKDYFVITTNTDGQFLKADFDIKRVFEVQGCYRWFQCSIECHDKLYNNENQVRQMLDYQRDLKVPDEYLPKCPLCNEPMEVNLRKDNFFVEDEHWDKMNNLYEKYVSSFKNKKVLLLEFGVGFNTPIIIRFPFEKMTYMYPNINMVRFNSEHCYVPDEIEDRTICVKMDISRFINDLTKE